MDTVHNGTVEKYLALKQYVRLDTIKNSIVKEMIVNCINELELAFLELD